MASNSRSTNKQILEQELPGYEIKSVLGSGSTSTVYRAVQLTLGRDVAIKRFAPHNSTHEYDLSERFKREAAIWAHLSHENLIHLYDYKQTQNAQYIILEYCHGLDLRELLDRAIRLPPLLVACIIHQVASALEYLHRFGIVHRDLKPGNIFIKSNGTVTLMDFGIAFSKEFKALTVPGSIMGTPAYMSPEQAMGKSVNGQSDLYSLGVLMFEMLEGFKPYKSVNLKELIQEVSKGRHKRLSMRIPYSLRGFVHKCMRKNPKRRPPSAANGRVFLEKFIHGRNVSQPRLYIQSYLVRNKHVNEIQQLFPDGLQEKTVKGPLADAFASISAKVEWKNKYQSISSIVLISIIALLSIGIGIFLYLYPELRARIWTLLSEAWALIKPHLKLPTSLTKVVLI